jgi:hypothetical protein
MLQQNIDFISRNRRDDIIDETFQNDRDIGKEANWMFVNKERHQMIPTLDQLFKAERVLPLTNSAK